MKPLFGVGLVVLILGVLSFLFRCHTRNITASVQVTFTWE